MTQNPAVRRRLLGEILKSAGIITEEVLQDGLKYQKETGLKLGTCLVNLGHCREEKPAA